MKSILCVVLLLGAGIAVAAQQQAPVPELQDRNLPGADDGFYPEDAPTPELPVRAVSAAEIQRETAQLDQLVRTVELQLNKASTGVFDKDLMKNLKAIEKLAKRLRGDLDR